MSLNPIRRAIYLSLLLGAAHSYADNSNIDVITVTATKSPQANVQETTIGSAIEPDLASWLDAVPGANVNRNGPVTGIAQYRGLFGDRVAVAVDGHNIVGAGPNAMDAPMSYVTALIVQSMSLYRGVAPVSAGINTFGGNISINMRKASFAENNELAFDGALLAGYRQQNKADTLASWVNVGQKDQALMLFANSQNGKDYQDGNGTVIDPTGFHKQQAGVDYRLKFGENQFGISYHYNDTSDSGSPALPMDIDYIHGNRFNLDGHVQLEDWQVDWLIGYLDATHAMDNYQLRSNLNLAKYRKNVALADSTDFKLHFSQAQGDQLWQFGLDGLWSNHDSTITNPNNEMFKVTNFNQVEDNNLSGFAQWQDKIDQTTYSIGARVKHNTANAGAVSHHMASANMMVAQLVNNANNDERKISDTNYDIALNLHHGYNDEVSFYAGLGLKQRAPSYQERYLWVPLEATGGLADGRTYIGDTNLNNETAYQLDLGLNYSNGALYVAPHLYYQRIDDYIQGIPTTNQAAKMVAKMMMGDNNPLQFANVDAALYGADIRVAYQLASQWKLTAQAAYVKGERKDINDNLYRIAPLNANIAVAYLADNWQSQLQMVAFAGQNKVSLTNQEQQTAGYGLFNWSLDYDLNDQLALSTGIDNLLDRQYQSHLAGYYRVQNSNIAPMSRVPGEGRNYFLELNYHF